MRSAFCRPEVPAEELERHRLRLVPEPRMVTLSSMLLRPRPARNRTPVLVIGAARDAVFDLGAQRETADAYGAELLIVPGAPHDLMLNPRWPAAATAITRFVESLAEAAPGAAV